MRSRCAACRATCRVWLPSWRADSFHGPTRPLSRTRALVRFFLQRFPPASMGPRLRGLAPLPSGVAPLRPAEADRSDAGPRLRGFVPDADPLEPWLPDPLLVFIPSGSSSPAPADHPFRRRSLSALLRPVPARSRGRWRSEVCSARGSAFLSRGSEPSRAFEPHALLRLFESGATRDYGFSSTVPSPYGGFRRLWMACRSRPEFDREELSVRR